jgi:hypothetical protein
MACHTRSRVAFRTIFFSIRLVSMSNLRVAPTLANLSAKAQLFSCA